ncbi:hypothetical protein C8J37_11634 [Rhizobium sp. PP-WC-1G-195]|nr:hypothetical protein C8J37_11634 [Rhizobium sp. PP-WC-1G-195]
MSNATYPHISRPFAVVAVISVVFGTGLGGHFWNSWSDHSAKLEANETRVEAIRQAAQEEEFTIVCREYLEASWIGRNTDYRRLSWCEKYRDRM